MPIRVVQLGTQRKRGEGLRIGTVRRPPRGVLKKDHARSTISMSGFLKLLQAKAL